MAAAEVVALVLGALRTAGLAAAGACVEPVALAEAERAAVSLAADRDHLVGCLTRLGDTLPRASGLTVVDPARGPFVLVRLPGAAGVRTRLRERGPAVRRGDTFPGLGPDLLRVAVRDRATTDRLLDALRDVLR